MAGFIRKLGRKAAPAVLKTRWVYHSLTGTEAERLEAEHSMGAYLTHLHLQEAELERDPAVKPWLDELTGKLTLALVNRERTFQVRCTAAGEPNAFALPGGFLFISRALLDLCEFDADEIAFVLAHEMGHVLRRHSFDRLMTTQLATLIARGSPASGILRPLLSQVIHRLITQGYSRQQEYEADRVAAQIIKVCGYDTDGPARLFQRLQSRTDEPGTISAYFSSHPPFGKRVARIREQLAERRLP